MTDSGLNSLLKWGVENSSDAGDGTTADSNAAQSSFRGLDQEALARLLGGPSDADRMRDAMATIQSADVKLDDKLVAFDNFEQLIENLDNANNMDPLGLWKPLVEQLDNGEPELQLFAAWCLGTAVQNNTKSQDKCLETGAIPKLVKLAIAGATVPLRKKAVYALSSEVRNFQPGLDALVKELPPQFRGEDSLDAMDMASVDVVINRLRDAASSSQDHAP